MAFVFVFLVLLVVFVLLFLLLYFSLRQQNRLLREAYDTLLHDHRSLSVKHGKSFEQLFPYMSNYPYDPRHFRFLGTPIDGLSFEPDEIVFLEFKTGQSTLSETQKRIKELVLKKKIGWKEIRS